MLWTRTQKDMVTATTEDEDAGDELPGEEEVVVAEHSNSRERPTDKDEVWISLISHVLSVIKLDTMQSIVPINF